jgi:transcriptional regulator with XRE-family HTH domain
MAMPKQQEGEDRDSVATALFAIILERKAKEYPNLKAFLDKIGMSLAAYYNLEKGIGNPTFWTVERTAKALGLSVWDMLGVDEKVMRAWLAGQNIDLDKLSQSVDARRQARQKFSSNHFAITPSATAEVKPIEQAAEPKPPAAKKPAAASKAKTRKTKPRKKA